MPQFSRALFAVVCDDIRQEVGNKLSLMGIYDAALLVQRFPATLPKLCFYLRAQTPIDRPFERIRFQVIRDDEVIAEGDVPIDVDVPVIAEDGSANTAMVVASIFTLQPVHFAQPCMIRFRAHTEGEELAGGAVRVRAVERPGRLERN